MAGFLLCFLSVLACFEWYQGVGSELGGVSLLTSSPSPTPGYLVWLDLNPLSWDRPSSLDGQRCVLDDICLRMLWGSQVSFRDSCQFHSEHISGPYLSLPTPFYSEDSTMPMLLWMNVKDRSMVLVWNPLLSVCLLVWLVVVIRTPLVSRKHQVW